MSRKKIIVTGLLVTLALFVLAGISWSVLGHTAFAAKEAFATGNSLNTGGKATLITSILASFGFTFGGLATTAVTIVAAYFGVKSPTGVEVSEVIELTTSFAALMKDKSNRAAQRRFFFALVDASRLIHGVTTSHVNGIVTLTYEGFAEPVVTEAKL